ncbi:hypothetical protein BH11ARM2_BH11ARM2_25140 [soil metagenome]
MAQLVTLLGAFVGSAFALVRFALVQSRNVADRFCTYLEGAVKRQEELNARFSDSIDRLGERIAENSALLARVGERMGL